MPRFAANIDFLFTERPFLERFAAAKASGFAAVEILFPYDHSKEAIAGALSDNELDLALINSPVQDWAEGGRGVAALFGHEAEFRKRFELAAHYAEMTKPAHVHIVAGVGEGPKARATYVENLRWACRQLPTQSFTIEVINSVDIPGYFLHDFDLADEILDELDEPNLHLQFDAYHAHKIAGDISGCWQRHGRRAAHVQVAGVPDRNEPHTGVFDYANLFHELDAAGYQGYVSGEYRPKGRTEDGTAWIR